MFKALRKRREVEFRYQCFANAIVAADYRNAHRLEDSQRTWSPMDYVACESDDVDPRREEAKRNIANLYVLMGSMTQEQAAKQKERVIRELEKQGFEDANDMFGEVFPEA